VALELALLSDVLSAAAAPGDALAALLDYPISSVEAGDRRGCYLCNAAVDMAQADDDVRALVDQAFADAIAAVESVARSAGAAPEAGAHLFSVFLGLRVMARSGAALPAMRAARDHALQGLSLKS
ncbi:MAG: hypothetical protein AAFP78_06275, partial [Pseudomonadota bacterium]